MVEETRAIAVGYGGRNREHFLPICPNHDIFGAVYYADKTQVAVERPRNCPFGSARKELRQMVENIFNLKRNTSIMELSLKRDNTWSVIRCIMNGNTF